MGVSPYISHDKFPRQSEYMGPGTRVDVTFNYELDRLLSGTIVRNDAEPPYQLIIRLDNGFCVLATECQYADAGGRRAA